MARYVCTERQRCFVSVVRFKKKKNHCNLGLETAEKCGCVSRPAGRNEAEGLPKANGKYSKLWKTVKIMEKRNHCKSGDSAVTASAVAAEGINLPKSTTVPLATT